MKSILSSIATAGLLATAVMAQPRYSILDLGTLQGGNSSSANYLTDNRLVGGNASDAKGTQQAVFWWGPFMVNLGAPGLNSGIFGFNANGQFAITSETSTKDPNNENFCAYGTSLACLAFRWQQGVLTALPTLGGANATIGNINSKGEIPGAAENSTRDPNCPTTPSVSGTGPQVLDFQAVVWGPQSGDIRELKPLAGDTVGIALWINDNSQAVGASGTCATTALPPLAFGPHAVLWDADGTVHDLGNLGGTAVNMGLAINNQGQVAGVSSLNDQATPGMDVHAFLWDSATGMRDLGTLPGDGGSAGTMLNDAGDVVGPSFDPSGNPRAYLWHDGVMSDLNDLAVNNPLYLLFATGINSRGEIVGFGVTDKGEMHGFLASPINSASARDRLSTGSPFIEEPRRLVRPALSDDARKLLQRLTGRYTGVR